MFIEETRRVDEVGLDEAETRLTQSRAREENLKTAEHLRGL